MSNQKKTKVLIFDMDGTIVDSDQVIIDTRTELIKLYKPKDYKIDIDKIRTYSGPPVFESCKDCFPEYDPNFMLKEYRERTKKYYKNLKTFPGCVEVINKLYKDGYKLAIVTSKNTDRTEASLKDFDIKHLFELLVTADKVTHGKPHPEGMNKVLEYFKITSDEALVIGDTGYDYFAAKNANIKCIIMKLCKRNLDKEIKPYRFVNSYYELYEVIKEHERK